MSADPIVTAARFLAGNVEWMRHRPEVADFARDIAACERVLGGIVDRPRERRYAGPCTTPTDDGTCGTDLYAKAGQDVATCRVCEHSYYVDECQAYMREQVRERLARPVEIAGVLGQLGFPITYRAVTTYVTKKLILAADTDERGRELYRIGDVIDVRTEAATRQQRRSA